MIGPITLGAKQARLALFRRVRGELRAYLAVFAQGQNTTTLINATTAIVDKQYSMACSRMASILSQWNMTSLTGGTLMRGSLVP